MPKIKRKLSNKDVANINKSLDIMDEQTLKLHDGIPEIVNSPVATPKKITNNNMFEDIDACKEYLGEDFEHIGNPSKKSLRTQTFSLDTTMALFILPRLIYFRKHTYSHPANMTHDEWKLILDDMIVAFYHCANNKYSIAEDKLLEPVINKGLKLFAEHFQHLWM